MLGAWNRFYNWPGQLTMWQKYLPEFIQILLKRMIRSRIKVSFTEYLSIPNTTSLLRTPGKVGRSFQVTTPAPPWLDCTLPRWPWGFWLQMWTTGISMHHKETRTVNDGLTISSHEVLRLGKPLQYPISDFEAVMGKWACMRQTIPYSVFMYHISL